MIAIKATNEANFKLENLACIPLSIFKNRSLSVLEALVFYLKNLGLSFKDISTLINRDQRTIWTVYQRAQKKKKETDEANFKLENLACIPLSIFKNRSLSVLEALVFYLKNLGLSFKDISTLINRDQRTIWTVFTRAKEKRGKS